MYVYYFLFHKNIFLNIDVFVYTGNANEIILLNHKLFLDNSLMWSQVVKDCLNRTDISGTYGKVKTKIGKGTAFENLQNPQILSLLSKLYINYPNW